MDGEDFGRLKGDTTIKHLTVDGAISQQKRERTKCLFADY